MQWKRPVDHFLSPPPGREGFMFAPCCCCWYAAGGGAVGGAPELLNLLLYASGGADGYIAWEEYDLLFMRTARRKSRTGAAFNDSITTPHSSPARSPGPRPARLEWKSPTSQESRVKLPYDIGPVGTTQLWP